MYTVLNVVLGFPITVTFICNESQVQEVIDFIGVCEGSAVDIIEQVEANFDCRAVSPATYDPFNWNSVVVGSELVDSMSTVLGLKDMAKHLMKILLDNMIDDAEVLAEAIWDLFIPVPFPSLEEMDYPRTCSHCGDGMYEGYCIDNGEEYYCSDECLHKHYTEEEYLEMYDEGNGDSYWTEWEDE